MLHSLHDTVFCMKVMDGGNVVIIPVFTTGYTRGYSNSNPSRVFFKTSLKDFNIYIPRGP